MFRKCRKFLAALTAAATALAMSTGTMAAPQMVKAADPLLAFPGATGAGRFATGGRGGEVYHVTNLNDSGEGSFRDAVSVSNRIVVFDVSGTIELSGNILCRDNITIAGQTAPGGAGITLKNYKMGMSGDNIICRFISSRPGPYKATSSGNDAWGGAKGSNSIIDHCSMGWTSDEQWGLYSNNQFYTVQYSVLGPANSWGGHEKGVHGFGIMMGKGDLTFDHNLIIHNVSRNFRGKVSGTLTADFTNNVIYDWGYQTAYGTIGHLNYVNNTLKAGNSTTGNYHWMYVDSGTSPKNFKVYCDGNQLINKDGSLHSITFDNWSGVSVKESIGITKNDLYSATPFQSIKDGINVSSVSTVESAAASFDHVVSFAGNGISPTQRTAIDQQCAADAKNGTGSCSGTAAFDSSVSELTKYNIQCGVTYNYPNPVLTKTITDNDNDGMDDEWELLRGLNPNDPQDYKGDYLGEGYMNIEYYINDLTVNAFPEGVVTPSPETGTQTSVSAFDRIEAEDYAAMEGIRTEDTSDDNGVQNIGFIENGDYTMYRRLDFGSGARSLTLRASGNPCDIELYLDRLDKPIGTIHYQGTGSFSKWEEITCNIPEITSVHNLYLKFTGGDGYLMNLNWFQFHEDAIPVSGVLVEDLRVTDKENMDDWYIGSDTAVGSKVFGDRDFTYVTFPQEMTGTESVVTACDSKSYAGDAATFRAAADLTVYVGLDQRVDAVPAWMEGYTKTAMTSTTSNDVTFDIYEKAYSAGDTVLLGANGQSYNCVNYTVNVKAAERLPEVTEATTEAIPTETTTTAPKETDPPQTTTAPQETDPPETTTEELANPTIAPEPTETQSKTLYGDVDCSGKVDIVDVIALNKSLLVGTEISKQGLVNADVDLSGDPTEVDSLLILKFIVKIITELPVV